MESLAAKLQAKNQELGVHPLGRGSAGAIRTGAMPCQIPTLIVYPGRK